jgi:hypothetical protein
LLGEREEATSRLEATFACGAEAAIGASGAIRGNQRLRRHKETRVAGNSARRVDANREQAETCVRRFAPR